MECKDQSLYINNIKINLVEAFGLLPSSQVALQNLFKKKNPYDMLFKQIKYERLKLYDKNDYIPQITRTE